MLHETTLIAADSGLTSNSRYVNVSGFLLFGN